MLTEQASKYEAKVRERRKQTGKQPEFRSKAKKKQVDKIKK